MGRTGGAGQDRPPPAQALSGTASTRCPVEPGPGVGARPAPRAGQGRLRDGRDGPTLGSPRLPIHDPHRPRLPHRPRGPAHQRRNRPDDRVGRPGPEPPQHAAVAVRRRAHGNRRRPAVHLYADRSRQLQELDPHGRELTMSCGAALLSLRVAAKHVGWETEVFPFPVPSAPDFLAAVTFRPGVRSPQRRAAVPRAGAPPDEPTAVPRRDDPARGLLPSWRRRRRARGRRSACSTERRRRRRSRTSSPPAMIAQGADPDVAAEMQAWLRPSGDPQPDGVRDSAQGVWDRHASMRTPGSAVAEHKGRLVREATAVLVLWTRATARPSGWRPGQALARVLVVAADGGLAASYANEPIEVDDLRPKVADLVGDGSPQAVFRAGYPDDEPESARRPTRDVVKHRTSEASAEPLRGIQPGHPSMTTEPENGGGRPMAGTAEARRTPGRRLDDQLPRWPERRDGDVPDHAAVDEEPVADPDGHGHAGHGGADPAGLGEGAGPEDDSVAHGDVGGDDGERARGVLSGTGPRSVRAGGRCRGARGCRTGPEAVVGVAERAPPRRRARGAARRAVDLHQDRPGRGRPRTALPTGPDHRGAPAQAKVPMPAVWAASTSGGATAGRYGWQALTRRRTPRRGRGHRRGARRRTWSHSPGSRPQRGRPRRPRTAASASNGPCRPEPSPTAERKASRPACVGVRAG